VVDRQPIQRLNHLRRLAQIFTYGAERGNTLWQPVERHHRRGTPRFSALAMKDIDKNPEQPGANIGAGLESMKLPPRPEQRLLDEVLGGGAVMREAAGESEQAPRMRHRGALEFVPPVCHPDVYYSPFCCSSPSAVSTS
jgi:hypothetical protein